MSTPQLAHAQLIPIENGEPDLEQAIEVQFNPTSLQVNLTNNLRAAENGADTQTQYIESSSSKLAIQLLFDSTSDSTDVRLKTIRIAEQFMQPRGEDNQAPKSCRFQWGSFSFDGMLQGYDETLDYFSPEGIPLRSSLSLNFVENRYQFEIDESVQATRGDLPTLTPAAAADSVDRSNSKAGASPREWRATALFNGIESARFPNSATISVPSVRVQARLQAQLKTNVGGFNTGLSASLGSGIPGAFED